MALIDRFPLGILNIKVLLAAFWLHHQAIWVRCYVVDFFSSCDRFLRYYVVRRVIGVYLCSDLQTLSSRPVLGCEPLWAVAFLGIGG